MTEAEDSSGTQRTLRSPGFVAYRYIIAGVVAFLPGALAYGVARLYGSLFYRVAGRSRRKLESNLGWFSIGGSTPEERSSTAKEFFVLRCCEATEDLMMLRGPAPLLRSVEIVGLDRLRESLSEGRGVVLCGAHFGSFRSALSLLGSIGYPATPIMRRPTSAGPGSSLLQRVMYWARSYALLRYMRRKYIPVQSGEAEADVRTALMAAKYLKDDEIVYVNLDATVIPENRSRALRTRFLGKEALFLTGAMSIAQMTGAKVHVMVMQRSKDLRRQRLTISPKIPTDGGPTESFRACLSIVESAVRLRPDHWEMLDLVPEHGTYFLDLG